MSFVKRRVDISNLSNSYKIKSIIKNRKSWIVFIFSIFRFSCAIFSIKTRLNYSLCLPSSRSWLMVDELLQQAKVNVCVLCEYKIFLAVFYLRLSLFLKERDVRSNLYILLCYILKKDKIYF